MPSIPRPRRRNRLAVLARRLAGPKTYDLSRCVACDSTFVCPISWRTDGPDHWLIQLYCGECGVWREVRATNAQAKSFDLVLDRQTARMEAAIADIDRERMQAEAEAFTSALQQDLIDANDFSRS